MHGTVKSDYEQQLELIKSGLLSLKATGADGFEGLLRIVLTKLTGIPFRLSASGLQGGMDGDSAISSDPVCFEAKRYSGNIDRNDVLVKIADLARSEEAADRLWILGATSEIPTQLAKAIKEDGDRGAISTLILDWTAAPLPLLAVAVVAAEEKAIDFIADNRNKKTGKDELSASDLQAAFLSISNHPDFENLLQRIKSDLNISKLALKRAVDLNIEWRQKTFSCSRRARERLRQGIAVLQDKTFPSMRNEIRQRISDEMKAGKEVILVGDEGHGKSWLAAQLCTDTEGLGLFISAEQLDGVTVDALDDFLIDTLIKQTDEVVHDTIKLRWRHRLKAWRANPPVTPLLVVIDGLNQRQSLRWDKLLNGIQSRLSEIGGRMVVTVRPHLWQKEIARGIEFAQKTIEVPEWSPQERDKLLKHYGVDLDWLDQKTLQTLKNPRLLAVAVATLPHRQAIAWKGLTTDRLLMEHLRASQRENYESETFTSLTKRLSDHAKKVLERVKAASGESPQIFQADFTAVIETRFFRPLAGPGDLYELRDEGLTLALGFTLVDQLWQQIHSVQTNLAERVTQLIEPINAMDRTADVIFASLLICSLYKDRFNASIFSALLDAFANLQNVNDQRFEEFVEIVKNQPEALFDTLKVLCLEKGQRINHDWFVHSAYIVASTNEGWLAAKIAIDHWLRCYNKDPVSQALYYHRQSDADYVEQVEKKKAEIDEELASLSAFEKTLLERMTEVSSETDELFTLALRLLAGRSLVDFANSFVYMGLALALNKYLHSARKAFQQLTTFNRVERTATRAAFQKAIEPLRTKDTSKGGQWTVVRMLRATGDESDADEASVLEEELRKDRHQYEPPSPVEWRQTRVANPDAVRPVDLDKGLQQFNTVDPDKLLQSMSASSEDHRFEEFLPVACRFDSATAAQKARSILTGLLTREGFPLRQVILNCEAHLPLVDPQLAKNLINRVMKSDAIETLEEAWGSNDDFDKKQEKLHEVANSFLAEIENSDARLLFQEFTTNDLRRFVSKAPMLLNELVNILKQANNAQFVWLKNLAFSVANLISAQDPDQAVKFLMRASASLGFVTQSLGDDLTLEHQAVWGSEVSEPIEALWRQRIMSSENNEILAREVLAAERFGAGNFIKSIVLQLGSSDDSLDQAYAITIAGYSTGSDLLSTIIREHDGDKGLTGQAAKHALMEQENAMWAQHWVDRMWNAPTAEEFWRCMMIAKTSMDARVSNKTPKDNRWALYAPVFQKTRISAIKKQNKKREKKLLGQEAPEPIFIKCMK